VEKPNAKDIARQLTELLRREQESLADADLMRDPEFVLGSLKLAIVGQIREAMERQGVSPADLARLLGDSRQRVSAVLGERGNLTLRTIARYAAALGEPVSLRIGEELAAGASVAAPVGSLARRVERSGDRLHATKTQANGPAQSAHKQQRGKAPTA
jgi:transcriptional regulator with XRE-family HTH domain